MASTPFGGAPDTCNALGPGATGQAFKAAADPLDVANNVRYFAVNAGNAIWEDRSSLWATHARVRRSAVWLHAQVVAYNSTDMWTKMMGGARKKAPKTIAVIDPDRCFGAFACSICQAACPVANCIVEEPDRDGRMVCAVRADLCIGCGLCVTLGNPTAPQQREFGCPADYDAINMMPFEEVVKMLTAEPADSCHSVVASGFSRTSPAAEAGR